MKRIIYLIIILLGFSLVEVRAQTEEIQGVVNHYASITSILASETNNLDSVVLSSLPPQFQEGDTVMIYCVQGAEIDLTEGQEGWDARGPRNTGKYAFLIINEILGNTVVFNTTVQPEIKPMGPGEVAQLIRVPSYHRARVTSSGVTALPWDGSTGGVVAMFVRTSLELNGDIDVSEMGFRGAEALAPLYNGDCSSTDLVLYDSSFYQTDNIRAGLKGEGSTDTRFSRMRGKAMNINGGGGGNGRLSGGGGGGNYVRGGIGGDESTACGPGVVNPGGEGGFDLGRLNYAYYTNVVSTFYNRHNRIFFGGGGGTGTVVSGRNTSSGGDGGGIVVIVADTIEGNSNWIYADGESVTTNATGAGGGGGGGGAIILDVSAYRNDLNLSAIGGDGGNTNHPSDTTGPGGGGGGGIYWLAGINEPGVLPDETGQGESGKYLSASNFNHGAADGTPPSRKDELDAPLRGFLFNSVPSEFWVCSNQVPETIWASEAKGGSGKYTYQWVDSSATQNQWEEITGATEMFLEFSVSLADTTYFRRIVKEDPQVLPADTSFRIALYVHQAISNNTISAPDTVCQGEIPNPFISVGTPGNGDGTNYAYLWEQDEGSGYAEADGSNDQPGYVPAGLNASTSFRRVITSGACVDVSSPLQVTVFTPISGNLISANDTICWNTSPGLLTQSGEASLGGGDPDPTNWRYQWERASAGTGPWTEVSAATASEYQPGNLTETTWYRRWVYSGNDNACESFSDSVEILNVPVITGNGILTDEQTVCTSDQPEEMTGSAPGGGLGGYTYLWEDSTASTGWDPADATTGNDQQSYTPPELNGDTTFYRRIVSSGGQEGVCQDISEIKVINVLPPIINNNITADAVLCQGDKLAVLNGSEPGGGATENGVDLTRNYRWEQSMGDAPGDWTVVSSGPDKMNYADRPELSSSDDYWYRRVVLSGPAPGLEGKAQVCAVPSNTVHIEIHTAISNNIIEAFDSVCFNTEKTLYGASPAGEEGLDTSYSWSDVVSGAELGTDELLAYAFTSSSADVRQVKRAVQIGVCKDTSAMMEITIMDLPGGILSGDLPKACEKIVALDVDLNIDTLTNYILPWEISFLNDVNDPDLVDTQVLEADGEVDISLITDTTSTQYNYKIGKLIYILDDGTICAAPQENMTGIVPIEVFLTPDPKITVSTELTDDGVCDNEVSLTVDPDKGTGKWESNYPDYLGFLNDPQDLSVRASIDPDNSQAWLNLPYLIYFRSEAGDCAGTDTVEISFFEQPDAAYAGVDDTIYLRNSTWLNADPASAGEGTWTTSGGGEFEDEHDPKTFVYNLDKGEINEFTWTIVNGVCVDKDDRSVISQDEAQAYEGFSPNGDMLNDYFIIRGLADATEFSISIFNALGRQVRVITQDNIDDIDYDPALIPGGLRDSEAVIWDGTASDNTTIVAAGTYYYVLSIMIEQVDDQGNVIETYIPKPEKHYIVVRD